MSERRPAETTAAGHRSSRHRCWPGTRSLDQVADGHRISRPTGINELSDGAYEPFGILGRFNKSRRAKYSRVGKLRSSFLCRGFLRWRARGALSDTWPALWPFGLVCRSHPLVWLDVPDLSDRRNGFLTTCSLYHWETELRRVDSRRMSCQCGACARTEQK